MIAQKNDFLSAASQSLYESNTDEITRQKCRAREEYYKREIAIEKLTNEVDILQQKSSEVLAEKDSIIEALQTELAKTHTQN